jgi:hypothetical protein
MRRAESVANAQPVNCNCLVGLPHAIRKQARHPRRSTAIKAAGGRFVPHGHREAEEWQRPAVQRSLSVGSHRKCPCPGQQWNAAWMTACARAALSANRARWA